MTDLLKLIQERQSARRPFDAERPIPKPDLEQILEAARWTPTAHNMQNFEIIVVDDKKLLKSIAGIKSPTSEEFIRENYQQLSFSEEELRRKKVGLLGTMFPASMRNPDARPDRKDAGESANFQDRMIPASSALLIVLYDPARRAPASEGDFLGIISLGCMMENMWLIASSLGIGFHIVSSISAAPVETEIKKLLKIPKNLMIAFSVRLGYAAGPVKYLRVRRDIGNFVHYNSFEKMYS